MTLTNSTVSGNQSDSVVIFNPNGTINITNSTLTGNTASGGAPGSAIFNSVTTFTNVTNCTILQNTGATAHGRIPAALKNKSEEHHRQWQIPAVTSAAPQILVTIDWWNALLAALGNHGQRRRWRCARQSGHQCRHRTGAPTTTARHQPCRRGPISAPLNHADYHLCRRHAAARRSELRPPLAARSRSRRRTCQRRMFIHRTSVGASAV